VGQVSKEQLREIHQRGLDEASSIAMPDRLSAIWMLERQRQRIEEALGESLEQEDGIVTSGE
jgi:hypothetical protein